MKTIERLKDSANHLEGTFGHAPRWAVLLGSGLSESFADLPELQYLDYGEIPHFPRVAVAGHPGKLTVGQYGPARFCALLGRSHFYEGWSMQELVFPVRALAIWGVELFVITNAAGAVNTSFKPGDLMLISDHVNLMWDSPLCGENPDLLGPRFPDMSEAYSSSLRRQALRCSKAGGVVLREGVYGGVRGPSYETPAEIRVLRNLGIDAVGMSTVPEVIALNHMGKQVLGISCITNMAAGVLPRPLDHTEVLEVVRSMRDDVAWLFKALLAEEPFGETSQ